jgi:hypothetical protein
MSCHTAAAPAQTTIGADHVTGGKRKQFTQCYSLLLLWREQIGIGT